MRKFRGLIRQSFKISLQNIITNKMRSFLTMLGIIIGVASVIGLITIVQIVTGSVMGQFSDLGAGTLQVQAPGTAMKKGLNERDIETLALVDGVEGISPSVSLTTSAVVQGEVYDKVSVSGRNNTYFAHNDVINSGRALTEADMSGRINVCIVDQTFIKKAMKGVPALGQEIELDGMYYTIVGIQKEDNSIWASMSDNSQSDGSITIPYKNALSLTGNANATSLDVYMSDDCDSSQVESDLRVELDKIYNDTDNAYMVINMESIMTMMSSVQGMMSTMLAGIASIALLVGGIGIMNMMLVSVSERTKEIGLRKALGAEPIRIQVQFLLESVFLSVFGGIFGVLLGTLIAFIVAKLLDVSFSISPGAILLGLGFASAVGIIFGWAPARRASRLNPIDALRSE